MVKLRDYQSEDVAAVRAAWADGRRRVLGRAATGLGKAVELAALVAEKMKTGRVLVLVDTRKLVRQLADTIEWYTGHAPAVHMSEERASYTATATTRDLWGKVVVAEHAAAVPVAADPVVVGTVQTMYSGAEGKEEYRAFDPTEFSALLLDECELFLAPKSKSVVDYFLDGNPAIEMFGCTATPIRTDGVSMGELFDEGLAFNRDIEWGRDNGWLVPLRQGFIRLVSIDFSTVKTARGDDGELDYTKEGLAEKLGDQKVIAEIGEKILGVVGTERTIVFCPTVKVARELAIYLSEKGPAGCSQCVYGAMGDDDEKDDVMDGHRRGDFPILTSVSMLTKGYDDPGILNAVICRKTKSKRLYVQMIGRATRPLKGVVDGPETAEARKAAIAASGKPFARIFDLVGTSVDTRDITLADVFTNGRAQEVVERAKEIIDAEGLEMEEAMERAQADVAGRQEEAQLFAEQAQVELDAQEEEDARIRQAWQHVRVDAKVEVEYTDDVRAAGAAAPSAEANGRYVGICRGAGVPDEVLGRMSADEIEALGKKLYHRRKAGLCSYKQARLLRRHGYDRQELDAMTFARAREAIEEIKENGWKRPEGVANG